MQIVLERPKTNLPVDQREKFLLLESSRATARAVWGAFKYGWRIMPSLAVKTDGRTTEKVSSPTSGVRYAEWQQPTFNGRLEVMVFASDLTQALQFLDEATRIEFNDFTDGQRYSLPSANLLEQLFDGLAVESCRYIAS